MDTTKIVKSLVMWAKNLKPSSTKSDDYCSEVKKEKPGRISKSSKKTTDTNNQMIDGNAEIYWMIAKAKKVAMTEISISFRW